MPVKVIFSREQRSGTTIRRRLKGDPYLSTTAGLSSREVDVLACLCQGLGNREIGSALEISVKTVEFHVTNILRKLGFSSRIEAVLYAAKLLD